MTAVCANPRSEFHALAPLGRGTAEVESLLSYFCRLAHSHSVSTVALSRSIAKRFLPHEVSPKFDWHQRQLAGIRESALTWSAALSALTSVQGLDTLTFLPWQEVIAQNGLPIVSRGQYCPCCLAEDIDAGGTPYFRLAWELETVTVCAKHGCRLQTHCRHCSKENIRHAAAFVVPGWCTHCGEFLGHGEVSGDLQDDQAARWRARQISELLAVQEGLPTPPSRDRMIQAITYLISEIDNGQCAGFARRVGVAKSTIHHWLKGDGTPTLDASLKIAAQTGASLVQLLTGNLTDWQRPSLERQLVLALTPQQPRSRGVQRELDWGEIESKLQAFLLLPTPISVLEAARRLDVEARQLYLRVNRTTRQLGERWKTYLQRRQEAHVVKAWPYIEKACTEIWAEGRAVTRREILAKVPEEIISPVSHLLNVLKDVQAHLQAPSQIPNET